jgi:hypothetical protein
MVDHPERWSSPFAQVEMRRLWTYSDGALTAKGYRLPGDTARAGSWVLVDQASGNVRGVVPPGEFSRRFRPVDLFADVPALATYLGTVTAADGAALVDLVLDRNPFMLANGPRQEVQHAHLHAFYAERGRTENHESSALEGYPVIGAGYRAFSASLGSDAVKVEPDRTRLAADVSVAAQPWGGSYCSYQLGVDGPFRVMPALGPSMDEFNRRLAQADGLKAEPDPKLGGAVNLVRPTLADAERFHAAQRATAEQRASFETFTAQHGLNPRSLDVGLAPGTLRAL